MIRNQEVLSDVVIKFAGDSGDGMQLTGTQFTNNTALLGIDLSTFPGFSGRDQGADRHFAGCEWLPVKIFKRQDFYTRRCLRCTGGNECSRIKI